MLFTVKWFLPKRLTSTNLTALKRNLKLMYDTSTYHYKSSSNLIGQFVHLRCKHDSVYKANKAETIEQFVTNRFNEKQPIHFPALLITIIRISSNAIWWINCCILLWINLQCNRTVGCNWTPVIGQFLEPIILSTFS